MGAPIVWLLNLDADEELERGAAYRVPEGERAARIEAFGRALAPLVADDRTLPLSGGRGLATGCMGRAFSPTPSALARLSAAGATPPRAPDRATLRRVNHRAFSAELGQTLPGATYAWTFADVERAARVEAGRWVLKRPFGFVGRGQRRVGPGAPSEADWAWVRAALATGEGLQVEPWMERCLDAGQHGYLFPDGRVELGTPTIQLCSATGAWISTRPAQEGELHGVERAALERATVEAASALARAGYFGAFGVDAFRFRDAHGVERFQPRSEINARYSMGWAIGMGAFRPPPGLP